MLTDLIGTPYKIYQVKGNKYNLDSILLANFVGKINKKIKNIYDFGCGNGVLMFYLSLKSDSKITGIEIQEELFRLAEKNINRNVLQKKLFVINKDIRKVDIKNADVIVSNPPYFKKTKNVKISKSTLRQIARHEIKIDLDSLLKSASKSLKSKGSLYLSFKPERLTEVINISKNYMFETKELRFVHPYVFKKPNLVLIKLVKNSNEGVFTQPPLVLYNDKGEMSMELKTIYKTNWNSWKKF